MGGGPTEFIGKVLSNKMMKSVLVAIDRNKKIPKYRTVVKRTTKLMAHDEHDECKVGDTVRIKLCRPLSKNKSYAVVDVLQKSKVLHLGGRSYSTSCRGRPSTISFAAGGLPDCP